MQEHFPEAASESRTELDPPVAPELERTLQLSDTDAHGHQVFLGEGSSPFVEGGSISKLTVDPDNLLDTAGTQADFYLGHPPAGSASTNEPAVTEAVPAKTSRLGEFVLLQKLGSGGMGAVYRARQPRRGRDVAVKVLYTELAGRPTILQRFYREARLMTILDHPNILTGYDVGQSGSYHYFAMELASGGSLEQWRARLGRFAPADAVHLVLACARALQHAHDLGLIHRDVKPDNVLLTGSGKVKLADLGLAKAPAEDVVLTKSHIGVGTPLYMSLEQALDAKRVDSRTDIYALGCMFYYFLTGKPPFNGKGLLGMMQAKEKGTFAPVRQHCADLPRSLEPIVAKMIARLPEDRFAKCADVIRELEQLGLGRDTVGFLESGC